ncbi:MAG: hypothetical protein NTW13_04520 [Candidatus Omnitrophica bacterium]|nr:hypothetical protein [Candidatus Omnitrophota bacterium]
MSKIKKSLIGFLILFGAVACSCAYAENVGVKVGVDKVTNQVTSVQIGDHGRILTRNEISSMFGNGTGPVSLSQFKQSANNFNSNYDLKAKGLGVGLGSGVTQATADKMLDYMDQGAQYMADNNLSFTPPATIDLGPNGAGSYSDEDSWHISNTSGDTFKEAIVNKTIQSTLRTNYPDLGYTANEAFSRYFTYDCLNMKNNMSNYIYNKNLESYTGNDIKQGYDDFNAGKITQTELNNIINNTMNNNAALSQSMFDAGNANTAFDALKNLANVSNPNGYQIKDAFIKTDPQHTDRINGSFNEHGV